jgi:VIT1/CCC1 family predicted Fe2+/Mn2+ transporter
VNPRSKAIGAAEVAAAIGLVLWAFDALPILTPLAATGLVLLMIGALMTHLRRNEFVPMGVINIMLGVLALIVAIGRFGDL